MPFSAFGASSPAPTLASRTRRTPAQATSAIAASQAAIEEGSLRRADALATIIVIGSAASMASATATAMAMPLSRVRVASYANRRESGSSAAVRARPISRPTRMPAGWRRYIARVRAVNTSAPNPSASEAPPNTPLAASPNKARATSAKGTTRPNPEVLEVDMGIGS